MSELNGKVIDSSHAKSTLYVRNLAGEVTQEALSEFFSEIGPVRNAFLVKKKEDSDHRGFAFVQYAIQDDAKKALEVLNHKIFHGKKLTIEIALRKHADRPVHASNAKIDRSSKQSSDIQMARPRLIVRNVSFQCQLDDLKKIFIPHGKLVEAILPPHAKGSTHAAHGGFAFIEFKTMEEAKSAIKSLNGVKLRDRTIAVDWAVPKDTYRALQEKAKIEKVASESSSESEIIDIKEEKSSVRTPSKKQKVPKTEEEKQEELSRTLFLRNLPFDCTETDITSKFSIYGEIAQCIFVRDAVTKQVKGTGFLLFAEKSSADQCFDDAQLFGQRRYRPEENENDAKKQTTPSKSKVTLPDNSDKEGKGNLIDSIEDIFSKDPRFQKSLLIDDKSIQLKNPKMAAEDEKESEDPRKSLQDIFVVNQRVVYVARAVNGHLAEQYRADETRRHSHDKRNLYLAEEGKLADGVEISSSDKDKRDRFYKEKKEKLKKNPNYFVSKTRLSIRNVPVSWDEKALKATVTQLTNEKKLSEGKEKSDIVRIKQVKIVKDDNNKSKGFAFVEFEKHEDALVCLREMNHHVNIFSRQHRPIVEFALEDMRVLRRREQKLRNQRMYDENQKKSVNNTTKSSISEQKGKSKEGGKQLERPKYSQEKVSIPAKRKVQDQNETVKNKRPKKNTEEIKPTARPSKKIVKQNVVKFSRDMEIDQVLEKEQQRQASSVQQNVKGGQATKPTKKYDDAFDKIVQDYKAKLGNK